jgi:hypothetical protein
MILIYIHVLPRRGALLWALLWALMWGRLHCIGGRSQLAARSSQGLARPCPACFFYLLLLLLTLTRPSPAAAPPQPLAAACTRGNDKQETRSNWRLTMLCISLRDADAGAKLSDVCCGAADKGRHALSSLIRSPQAPPHTHRPNVTEAAQSSSCVFLTGPWI